MFTRNVLTVRQIRAPLVQGNIVAKASVCSICPRANSAVETRPCQMRRYSSDQASIACDAGKFSEAAKAEVRNVPWNVRVANQVSPAVLAHSVQRAAVVHKLLAGRYSGRH